MSQSKQTERGRHQYLAWIVWSLAATLYFSDYLARVIPVVMQRSLHLDFGLTEMGLQVLRVSFFIPYLIAQIPVGLMIDRYSVRWILTAMSLVTALGCCVFGLADSVVTASIGRVIIGVSSAFTFVSCLWLAVFWFPSSKLGLMVGLTQAAGMLGMALGGQPLAFLAERISWRHTMLLTAFLFIALAALIYQFVRDKPEPHKIKNVLKKISVFDSIKKIASHPQIWVLGLYSGFMLVPIFLLSLDWGFNYLQQGRGLNSESAAFSVSLIFAGWVIGGPLSGWISDKLQRRKPFMISTALLGILLMSTLVFYPAMDKTVIYFLMFCFGFTNTGVIMAYAASTEIQPRNVLGTAIAFVNFCSIFVSILIELLINWMSDYAANNDSSQLVQLNDIELWILPVCLLIAFLLALMSKETYCKPVN